MEKLYTGIEYANKVSEAQADNKMLYRIIKKVEYIENVPDYEITGYEKVEQEVFDEETGETKTVIVEIPIKTPVMVETEDEEGNKYLIPQTHEETRTKTVEDIEIQDRGYYICQKENITDGTLNENYETEKAEREQEKINRLTMTALDFKKFFISLGGTTAQFHEFLDSNIELKDEIYLCQNVYCGVVKSVCPLKIGDIEITIQMVEKAFIEKSQS